MGERSTFEAEAEAVQHRAIEWGGAEGWDEEGREQGDGGGAEAGEAQGLDAGATVGGGRGFVDVHLMAVAVVLGEDLLKDGEAAADDAFGAREAEAADAADLPEDEGGRGVEAAGANQEVGGLEALELGLDGPGSVRDVRHGGA